MVAMTGYIEQPDYDSWICSRLTSNPERRKTDAKWRFAATLMEV